MIPKECKRLAEVDFPIAVVSKHAASEKYVRYTPNTALHTWWAQRPLVACRSMLMALLLPDSCDKLCPADFKAKARELLPELVGTIKRDDLSLRRALLKFIGDFANWDHSAHPVYLKVARGLVKAAHGKEPPLVVDPFAGAGSIPLEALRLGCDAFASDLNPVACLILKVMLEDIPRHGPKLAEELRKVGKEIKEKAEKELAEFYPTDPDGARPIAYIWARTVFCESPNCGAEIPLVPSLWLCKKANRKIALRAIVSRVADELPRIDLEVFEPQRDDEVLAGTISRAKARCLACGGILQPQRVKAQLSRVKGGTDVLFDVAGRRIGGARLLAVVTQKDGIDERQYRDANERDYVACRRAQEQIEIGSRTRVQDDLSPFPDEPLPPIGTLGFRVQRYGVLRWQDLFTARQNCVLATLSRLIADKNSDLRELDRRLLSFAVSKFERHFNGNARWNNVIESVEPAFGQGTLPITWTFPESIPWGKWAENFDGSIELLLKCIEKGFSGIEKSGSSQIADARNSPLPDSSCDVWFTDPPYYDAIPYADLSDFFFVRLKRSLPDEGSLRDPFDSNNPLTPKSQELVQDNSKSFGELPKDKAFFEREIGTAFSSGRRVLKREGIALVVFAHKTTGKAGRLLSTA
jgi:adenine-specific DNA methylase